MILVSDPPATRNARVWISGPPTYNGQPGPRHLSTTPATPTISRMTEGTHPSPLPADAPSLWQICIDRLAQEIPEQQFNT